MQNCDGSLTNSGLTQMGESMRRTTNRRLLAVSSIIVALAGIINVACGRQGTGFAADSGQISVVENPGGPVAQIVEFSEKVLNYSPSDDERRLARQLIEQTRPDVDEILRQLSTDEADRQQLESLLHGLSGQTQFRALLSVLVSRRPVDRGLTDEDLEASIHEGVLQRQINRLVTAPAVQECLKAWEDIPPERLAELLPFLSRVYFVGENPYSFDPVTWAAESLAKVTQDVMLVELVNSSVVGRILLQEGIIKVPEKTVAEFAWSGLPSVVISLSVKPLGSADRADLERLQTSPHRVYAEGAKRALASIAGSRP